MKYSCEVVRDLIPIYIDGVCSEASADVVEGHVKECTQCKEYLNKFNDTQEMEVQLNELEEKQKLDSLKKVKKKMKIKTILAVLGAIIASNILMGVVVCGIFVGMYYSAKVETHTDVSKYEKYIGKNAKSEYRDKWGMDETILPKKIREEMKVKDFSITYYNPMDAQYVTYLTIEYTDEDYKEEIERLKGKGVEKYEGYYSVQGAPEGYKVLAMDSDEYQGFVYAISPENEDNTITYVEIIFCNYFLDLDIDKYLPNEYLLKGFDATVDNPYMKEKTKQ